MTQMKPGSWGTKDGKPAITWWRYGEAAKGEPSEVTEVRTYETEVDRIDAAFPPAPNDKPTRLGPGFLTEPVPVRIGGSILPSSDPTILKPLNGLRGVLQVRPIPEADTYGLFFTDKDGTSCLAQHSNGYSCHNLAVRLVDVWSGKREPAYALAQFDYILSCGGLGKGRESIAHIAAGLPEASAGHEMKPLQELHQLWGRLADIPVSETDKIEVKFLDFEKGTPREDIWRWFESQNSNFFIGEIQSGVRRTDEPQSMERPRG